MTNPCENYSPPPALAVADAGCFDLAYSAFAFAINSSLWSYALCAASLLWDTLIDRWW
jgi:hypothetical protein